MLGSSPPTPVPATLRLPSLATSCGLLGGKSQAPGRFSCMFLFGFRVPRSSLPMAPRRLKIQSENLSPAVDLICFY